MSKVRKRTFSRFFFDSDEPLRKLQALSVQAIYLDFSGVGSNQNMEGQPVNMTFMWFCIALAHQNQVGNLPTQLLHPCDVSGPVWPQNVQDTLVMQWRMRTGRKLGLKVSKYRKQILKFSFKPKNERKYFCITALASKKPLKSGRNKR